LVESLGSDVKSARMKPTPEDVRSPGTASREKMFVLDVWQQGETKPQRMYLRAAGMSILGATDVPTSEALEGSGSSAEVPTRPKVQEGGTRAPKQSLVEQEIEFYDRLIPPLVPAFQLPKSQPGPPPKSAAAPPAAPSPRVNSVALPETAKEASQPAR
jgi:hypothetical protein